MSMTKRAYESAGNPFPFPPSAVPAGDDEEAEAADRFEEALTNALNAIGVTGVDIVARRLGYRFN